MRNLRRTAAILTGILGVTGGAAAVVVGCGGDDTIIGVGGDSGADVSTSDVSIDTGVTDAAKDAFTFDAGPPAVSLFDLQINQTGCAWLQNCCGGPSQFDMNACLATFNDPATAGWFFTRPLRDELDGGGNVTFDETKANQCLSLLQAMSCTDPLTSAQAKAIRDACYGAIVGNIPVGSTGCRSDLECVPNAYCDPAGGGTCRAPLDAGSVCVNGTDSVGLDLSKCGRPFAGEPGYCQVGDPYTALEAGTCSPPGSNGSDCVTPMECQSWLCDLSNTATCVDTAAFLVPGPGGTCDSFVPADAGDGG